MAVETKATLRCGSNFKGVDLESGWSTYTSADRCFLELDYCSARRLYRGNPATPGCFVITPSCQCLNYVLDHAEVVGTGVTVTGGGSPGLLLAEGAVATVTVTMQLMENGTVLTPSHAFALRQQYAHSVLRASMSEAGFIATYANQQCQTSVERGAFARAPTTFTLTISRRPDHRWFAPEQASLYASIGVGLVALVVLCMVVAAHWFGDKRAVRRLEAELMLGEGPSEDETRRD